jgi:hypothetical protein
MRMSLGRTWFVIALALGVCIATTAFAQRGGRGGGDRGGGDRGGFGGGGFGGGGFGGGGFGGGGFGGGAPGGPGGPGGAFGGGGRGGFDPTEFLRRADANGNGVIDPQEMESREGGFARRMAERAGIDVRQGVPIERLASSMQQGGGGERGGASAGGANAEAALAAEASAIRATAAAKTIRGTETESGTATGIATKLRRSPPVRKASVSPEEIPRRYPGSMCRFRSASARRRRISDSMPGSFSM